MRKKGENPRNDLAVTFFDVQDWKKPSTPTLDDLLLVINEIIANIPFTIWLHPKTRENEALS